MRITNRDIEWYDDFIRSIEEDYYIDETNNVMYSKLKALEDIEEDIGMSLLELFRILKCGQIIYKNVYNYKHKIVILETRNIDGLYYDGSYYILKIHNISEDDNDNYDIVYVKDYGITYALTKEELEDDK